jgi:phosphoesterase RecJ-like protein
VYISMKEVINALRNIKSAVILPHVSADGDAIGSCRAMKSFLHDMGINAVIYTEESVEKRLEFLADGINVYDGDISPLPSDFDTCIVLDCGDEERLGKRINIVRSASRVINIDHHKTNTKFGDVNLVMPDASATGEVLALVFKETGTAFTKETAYFLYAAICSDTGRFAYTNTSPQTFRIAADLIETGINHAEISHLLFECSEPENELLRAELIRTMHSYFGGRIRTVSASEKLANQCGMQMSDIQDIVDIPRRIRGTQIAASFKEADGKVRVSMRSNDNSDVSEIALSFGGGGHAKAAGCTIDTNSLEEAERKVVEACKSLIV